MGRTGPLVLESVGEIRKRYQQEGRPLRGVLLFTGCLTEFLNVDFPRLIREIASRYGLAAAHYQESRFQRFDPHRPPKRDLYECLSDFLREEEIELREELREAARLEKERREQMMQRMQEMRLSGKRPAPPPRPRGMPGDMHRGEIIRGWKPDKG